ncbi:uncharacterized protein TRIADDRAFT_31261 [Trichoplax adhaerens]|uniref:Fucose mutarotase n=1 Tax=Trichoplax adhaerens TaxID=10228 RepID=B3S8V2_TRIAD|nr:hypothetical protein TRIADDRAFT_31261 [Trichoplax adhaerens]EDV20837.1 hypothetical protein TRIADDRAFT_31261 [Trichoplax adhaerens]|eukprot:XP_002116778.1 hypothetical protein TRIADDRAFT_31261 [Trichoplax adhaerens]
MVMLKNIPSILSPEMLYALGRMGHGDELVLADANFPSASVAKAGPEIIRADGVTIPQLLDAILQLMPLDTYSAYMAAVMDLVDSDKQRGLKTPVWQVYSDIIEKHEGKKVPLHKIERFEFYDQAKKAFLVIATGSVEV